jgi:hypothetical protein
MNVQVLDRAALSVVQRDIVVRPQAPKMRLSRKQLGIAGATLLVGLGVAWYGHDWWTVGRFIESTDDAYVGGDVTVIAPKVAGFIANVAVTDNQQVHAGDLLVRLDDRDYRAALAKAVAGVAGQQATLANLDAASRLQEAVIAQAQAELPRPQPRPPAPNTMSIAIAAWRTINSARCSVSNRRMPTIRRRSPPIKNPMRRGTLHSASSTSSTPRSSRRQPPSPAPRRIAIPRSSILATRNCGRRSMV